MLNVNQEPVSSVNCVVHFRCIIVFANDVEFVVQFLAS